MVLSELDVIILNSTSVFHGNTQDFVLPFADAGLRNVFIMVAPTHLNRADAQIAKLKQDGSKYKNVYVVPLATNQSSAQHLAAAKAQLDSIGSWQKLSQKFFLINNLDYVKNISKSQLQKMLVYDEVYNVRPMLVDSVISGDANLPALGVKQENAEVYVTSAVKEFGIRHRATGLFLMCADCLENSLPLLLAATHKNGVQTTVEPVSIYDLLHYFANVGVAATLFSENN